jgi:threonine dehydrogenase-like Zn-dependent dehydrogenase
LARSGRLTARSAHTAVASGGRFSPLGQAYLSVSRELDLRGSFRSNDEMDRALAILAETPAADELITHAFPLDRASEAFGVATDGHASCKVLLEFDGS